jgi:hypothetical protein
VTPGLLLGPHPCNAFALTLGLPSSWPATLQPLSLGREPKARVATSPLLFHCLIVRYHVVLLHLVNWYSLPTLMCRWRSFEQQQEVSSNNRGFFFPKCLEFFFFVLYFVCLFYFCLSFFFGLNTFCLNVVCEF